MSRKSKKIEVDIQEPFGRRIQSTVESDGLTRGRNQYREKRRVDSRPRKHYTIQNHRNQ